MRISADANLAWNDSTISLIKEDGVYLLSIHEVGYDPDTGATVQAEDAELRAFFKMCLHMLDVLEAAQ